MRIFKIFPVKLMSNYDVFMNFCKIKSTKTTSLVSEPDVAIINNMVKTLKEGRNICEKH